MSNARLTQISHLESSWSAGQSIMPATNSDSCRLPSRLLSTLDMSWSSSSDLTSYPSRSKPSTSSVLEMQPELSTSSSSNSPESARRIITEFSDVPASITGMGTVSSWISSAISFKTSCLSLPYVANRCSLWTTDDRSGSVGAASLTASQGCCSASLALIRLFWSL